MDCSIEDMFNAALLCLVFMGQTHGDGITYVRDAPGGRRYVHWSDSDWAVRRSTSGGSGQLAGATVQAMTYESQTGLRVRIEHACRDNCGIVKLQ